MTEFLIVVWIFCHEKIFLCRDIILLPCIDETKLIVVTDDESKTNLFLIHFSGMFLTILDLF